MYAQLILDATGIYAQKADGILCSILIGNQIHTPNGEVTAENLQGFTQVESTESAMALFNLCLKTDYKPVQLKTAVLYQDFVVIIGSNGKTVTKTLEELSAADVAPLNTLKALLAQMGVDLKKLIYEKESNELSINGLQTPANQLGQTPLLDEIEAVCVRLLKVG